MKLTTNNKAQGGAPIAFVFGVIIFIALWALWFGEWIAAVGQQAIIDGSLTGIEAFFYANLNLVVLIGLILGTMGFFYWAGFD